ncbi:SRPBCC family protein [Pectobacterium versatile]|uniref:SRPBCC family protein n=1 Tax=Pectobacterium versatile TaxID=2488639 RepID=UPI002B24E042|nr:SRPBCC family protein [Pectobacterium versatile]
MPVVKFNATVQADARHVWQTLREFGRISEWHPSIHSSEIEENQPDGLPGCRRKLILENGDILREQLLMVDEERLAFSYRFIEAPLPVDNYVANVSLLPLSGRSETVVAWQASFEVRSRDDAQVMEKTVMDLIVSGHQSLADFLKSR